MHIVSNTDYFQEIKQLNQGDLIWFETDSSISNNPLKSKVHLTIQKLENSGMIVSCDIATPVVTKLVKLNSCGIDTDGVVDKSTGVFVAPQDGVYKTSFTGAIL